MEAITNIQTMLTEALGPFGPILVLGLIGVLMILLTLPVLMKRVEDPLDKLHKANKAALDNSKRAEKLRTGTRQDKLERYSTFLEPQDAEEFSAVKLKLMQAGYKSRNAVRFYYFAQFALGLLGLIVGGILLIVKSGQGEISQQNMILMVLGPGAAGYFLPKYWVTRRQMTRQENITNAFPDSLDLMLVCVEAGQSLDQAIIRVAKELRAGFPDLSLEFEIVAHEMKAGKAKDQVLRDMSERCGVADISSFVTVLIQSQQFGTSIADALRVYASEMRDKRVMRAEEAANKLPTKMTLATMMLTVPPLLVILIGPSIYNIANNLGGSNL